jgi:nucleoside-diphosphate-sugar epimerase
VLSVYDALVGIEEVYHAAGLVSFDPRQKERLMDVNARGTENVVNMALERGVQRLCHVSSVAALGRAEDGQKVNEQTSWKDSKFNSTYAISKYAAEREVWRGMEEGLSAVILNPTIILGPGGWDTGSGLLFRAVWNGLKFYPQGTNGFVDVRDVARVGISLMEQQRFGARFVVSSEDVSYEYLFTEIARALGRKPPRIKASPFMTGLAWRLDKVRSGITGGSPVITKETAMTSSSHWYYDASESVKATGSGYIPVLQSVHDWAETFLKTYR